ncbi:MAG: undecaprenyl-diphosphate phosphatase [Rhodobacteraceae bacterium]|nr:undecaprenyl-diphosphate phosphatase [Paracoccaceae bacterium]
MDFFHLFLLAAIQGLTEFLPVSSSGHLILLPLLTGYRDQGQVLDVAVHVGTLFAVILYFRRDSFSAFAGLGHLARGRRDTEAARLAWLLIVATVPVIIAGLILKLTGLDDLMRSVKVIGWTMLIFGIVLYWTDQKGGQTRKSAEWNLRDAVIMGLWQALALIPGTSRSGATISGARALGYGREDAARIAMLMSIPTIIASGTLLGLEVAATADAAAARDGALAALMAFVAALLALGLMMRLLRSVSFTPYVIYRIALGVVLLVIAYR